MLCCRKEQNNAGQMKEMDENGEGKRKRQNGKSRKGGPGLDGKRKPFIPALCASETRFFFIFCARPQKSGGLSQLAARL